MAGESRESGYFGGRVAIVTGASSGIGRALVIRLAQAGCKVGLLARRRGLLEQVVGQIQDEGGTAAWATADVTDRDQVRQAFADLTSRLGSVSIVVANAGVGVPTTLEPMNITTIETMIKVNVLGLIYTIEAALPTMLDQKSGQIAAISSLSSYKGMPGESAYCASKAAVNAYMEGLRVQVRDRGISVTTICPGFVKTPMTDIDGFPMLFPMEADEAAARVIKALRKRLKVVNFPWQTTALIKMARWMPDWALARIFRHHLDNPPMLNPPQPARPSTEVAPVLENSTTAPSPRGGW